MKKKKTNMDYYVKFVQAKMDLGFVQDDFYLSDMDAYLKQHEYEWVLNKDIGKLHKKWIRVGGVKRKWRD